MALKPVVSVTTHNNTTVPVRALLYLYKLYLTLPALRLASAEEPRGERTSPYAGGTPYRDRRCGNNLKETAGSKKNR